MSKSGSRRARIIATRVGDDVEVAQTEEVHLQQAERLDTAHLVLGDDRGVVGVLAGLGLALDRQVGA